MQKLDLFGGNGTTECIWELAGIYQCTNHALAAAYPNMKQSMQQRIIITRCDSTEQTSFVLWKSETACNQEIEMSSKRKFMIAHTCDVNKYERASSVKKTHTIHSAAYSILQQS